MPAVVHRNWQSQFLAPAPVYLDASITVAWLTTTDRLHTRALTFTGDHVAANRELLVSLLTVDETVYRLLRGMIARVRGVSPRQINPGLVLKQHPKLLGGLLPDVRLALGFLLAWTRLVDGGSATPQQILDSWLDRFNDISAPHDAWHLSLAEHAGAKSFATGDADFQAVKNLPFALYIVKL